MLYADLLYDRVQEAVKKAGGFENLKEELAKILYDFEMKYVQIDTITEELKQLGNTFCQEVERIGK